MTVQKKLRGLFGEILKEAEHNPAFAERLDRLFRSEGEMASDSKKASDPSARKGRRAPGVMDPFAVYLLGEVELIARLEQLGIEQLKDIVAENGMDRSKLAMKWKTKEKLIPFIVKTVSSRSSKGDAFRQPVTQPSKDTSLQTAIETQTTTRVSIADLETASVQELLRAADVIGAQDPRTEFHEQLYVQHSVTRGRALGTGPHHMRQVEIDLDSTSPRDIERARAVVRELRK